MRLRVLGTVLAVGTAFLGPVAHAAEDPDPVRILLVGDSITQGSVGDWTWRYRLWQNLQRSGVAVDFVGPYHELYDPETADFGAPGYADPAFDSDHAALWGMPFGGMEHPIGELVEEYRPDVVVEMLGTNDLAFDGKSVEEVAGAASELVAEARAADPGVAIVLGQLPNRWVGGADAVNWWLEAIAADRDRPDARVVTARVPATYELNVDTYDGLHPAATGEVKLAESVAVALAELGVGTRPHAFPLVVNGPATVPELSARIRWGVVQLTWSLPAGATGVYVWRRDLTAGGDWTKVPTRAAYLAPPRGHRVAWQVQAYKGTAVSPRFSTVVLTHRGAVHQRPPVGHRVERIGRHQFGPPRSDL